MSDLLTVGAVFRRETRWLREWVEFHLMMGVDRFYLFNHATPGDDPQDRQDAWKVLHPYITTGKVVYFPFDEADDFQMKANNQLLDLARTDGARWMAILDLDEFLFPVSPRRSLVQCLEADCDADKVAGRAVFWRCYGSSGLKYPPMLQTEAFTMRADEKAACNYTYKYVFRPENVESYAKHDETTSFLDENGEAVVKGKRFGTCNKLRMNHYVIRSYTDWLLRVQRRFPPNGFRLDPKDLPRYYEERWAMYERNEVEDPILHRYLPELKRRLGIEY